MQLWGHVRRSAPLRGAVRRRRAQEGASLGALARPRGRTFLRFSWDPRTFRKALSRDSGFARPAFNDALFQAARDAGRLAAVTVQRDEFVLTVAVDPHPVFRQGLGFGHLANAPGEIPLWLDHPRPLIERIHAERDSRNLCLVRHRLAGEAVQPAFEAARQLEVIGMDGENFPLPQNRVVEPWRQ